MPNETYEVINATTRPVVVDAAGKKMPFGKLGAFRVKDPGVANEIRAKYGRDVTVTKINAIHADERKLHPNRIISPGMPWHKYDDFGRKVKDKDVLPDSERTDGRESDLQTDRDQDK